MPSEFVSHKRRSGGRAKMLRLSGQFDGANKRSNGQTFFSSPSLLGCGGRGLAGPFIVAPTRLTPS